MEQFSLSTCLYDYNKINDWICFNHLAASSINFRMAAGDTEALPFACGFERGIPFYDRILASFGLILLVTLMTVKKF